MPALTGMVIAANTFNFVAFFVDAAGVVTAALGTQGATLAQARYPQMPKGKALIGALLITHSSTFTGGTTPLDTATTVYINGSTAGLSTHRRCSASRRTRPWTSRAQLPSRCASARSPLPPARRPTLSNTGTTTYAIRGKAYSKAAMTNAATPTTDAATGLAFNPVPANNGCAFLIGFNAAGALLAVQGDVVPLNPVDGSFASAPPLGGPPLDFCPIGYLIIKAGSTASSSPGWLFGSSNMSGVTGITYTFADLMGIPDRPQIS